MEKEYTTSELPLAAALMCGGVRFLGARGNDDHHLNFVFLDGGDGRIAEIERTYFSGELRVEPIAFTNATRTLRAEIKRRRTEKWSGET